MTGSWGDGATRAELKWLTIMLAPAVVVAMGLWSWATQDPGLSSTPTAVGVTSDDTWSEVWSLRLSLLADTDADVEAADQGRGTVTLGQACQGLRATADLFVGGPPTPYADVNDELRAIGDDLAIAAKDCDPPGRSPSAADLHAASDQMNRSLVDVQKVSAALKSHPQG